MLWVEWAGVAWVGLFMRCAAVLSLSERRRDGFSREFSLALPGAAGCLCLERGAEFWLAGECVAGRLGGDDAGWDGAASWVGSATGAAGWGDPSVGAAGWGGLAGFPHV